jgi:RNA polymerase sigma-70 factor, ECF subfamily
MDITMEYKAYITDETLMWSYAQGDYQAFEHLYQRHSKKVYGYILLRIKNTEESEEVFQTTFRKLHGSLNRYKQGMAFLPWMFTICKHCIIDNRRKDKRKQASQFNSESIESLADESIQYESDNIRNVKGYDRLKQNEKDVLDLKYVKDYDFNQISEQLGYTAINIRKIVSRALQKLRKSKL